MTRGSRMVIACVASVAFGMLLPAVAPSQSSRSSRGSVDRGVLAATDRARGMTDRGQGVAARRVLDSLVAAQPGGSDESAEALYWRGTLADRAADAERDWKRLTIEAPLSPRMPDALLWLGELSMVRRQYPVARGHLERLLRDYRDGPQRPTALLWIARSYLDERDIRRGCAAVVSLRAAEPSGEIRLQADELGSRCTGGTAP